MRRLQTDAGAVSPVIATILLVAITVVLAAVLYVMITSIITHPGSLDVMGISVQTTGENWSVQVVSVAPDKLPQSTYLLIRDPLSQVALPPTPWSNLTAANWPQNKAQYSDGSPAKPEIQPGDVLLISRLAYPSGCTIVISDDTNILATQVL